MTKKIAWISLLAISAMIVLPGLAVAQGPDPVDIPGTEGPVASGQGIIDLLEQILTWVAIIFWVFAAGFVFYAGFLYLTAGGSPEKVAKAQKQLTYAIIAIVIGIMAYGLPRLVFNILSRQ